MRSTNVGQLLDECSRLLERIRAVVDDETARRDARVTHVKSAPYVTVALAATIDASEEERDLGLGIYCCVRLMACDFQSDDEAIVLFRVASERYAYAIAAHGSGKNPAAEMANLRHAESRALTRDAVRHWRENIDPSLSAQKAATELTKIVPLSHKKLAEIVSKAKKGIVDDQ